MQHAERRIRKLSLSASDHSHLQQARYCLEEAFRSASLPGLPPSAQVVIRRLELGRLRSNLPANLLAERIANLVRNLAVGAVCVDERPAPDAQVVWFSDPLRPYQALLRTLLDDGVAHAWYWRSLFPGRDLRLTTATVEGLLLEALRTPVQVLAPAHVLQAVLAPRRLEGLLPHITPALVGRLLHAAGLSPMAAADTGSPVHDQHRIHAPDLNRDWRHAIATAVDTWGEADTRSRWLAWNALILRQPVWLACRDVLPRMDLAGWLTAWSGERVELDGNEITLGPPLQKGETGGVVAAGVQHDVHPPLSAPAWVEAPGSQHAQDSFPPLQRDVKGGLTDPPAQPEIYEKEPGPVGKACCSSHAGFAFMIPVLQRLALSELLERNQRLISLDFPRYLLWSMARRFRLAQQDPLWMLFQDFEPRPDIALVEIQIPVLWRQLSDRPPATASPRELANTLQLLAAAYLRRYCKLSLRGLIQRPGRIALTPTHWDVHFDINDTDLRLRRVALDSDPGWVPWLGRVVQFHYHNQG